MTATDLCAELDRGLGELFACAPHGDYCRIRTPYLYPDGDNIDLFCKAEGDVTTVSDLGETNRWLRTQTFVTASVAQAERIDLGYLPDPRCRVLQRHVLARCRPGDSLAAVVLRVAQAALRVSDLWFTFRTRAVESVTDEVADVLTEGELSFERAEKLAGRSGRTWTVDFQLHPLPLQAAAAAHDRGDPRRHSRDREGDRGAARRDHRVREIAKADVVACPTQGRPGRLYYRLALI